DLHTRPAIARGFSLERTMTFTKWLQSRLTAHQFPCGPIDGIVGDLTTAALRAFQAAKGLSVTGTATPETVTFLRMSATDFAAPMPEREHIDPAAVWPRQSDVPEHFGAVGENQTTIEVPFDMVLAWDTSHPLRRMTLHRQVAGSALAVLNRVAEIYSEREIRDLGLHLFGGSLNVRRMRGGSSYSMHSWGIAIDFDPQRNQLSWNRPRARLSQEDAEPFWTAWENEGWVSLGRSRNFDWMHVQAARL
uniref:peptidoglycan-binding protein n=1 Tax=Puniceibacterium confluentis TaxID=1958944 RepID=UPI001C943360